MVFKAIAGLYSLPEKYNDSTLLSLGRQTCSGPQPPKALNDLISFASPQTLLWGFLVSWTDNSRFFIVPFITD